MTRRPSRIRCAARLLASAAGVACLASPAAAQATSRTSSAQPTNRQTTQQTTQQTTTNDNPNRGPSGGTRSPGGGVRAPGGGVRAPGGGVRGPGTPGVQRPEPRTVTFTGVVNGTVFTVDSSLGGHFYWPCYGYGWGWGWGRWNRFGWGYYQIPDRYAGTVDGPQNRELEGGDPEPEPLTPIESARAWMFQGNADEAARWYREYLEENPDDARVMREYAAAMQESGRMLDAVAMMAYAYSQDPGLVNEPMPTWIWGDSPFRMREAVTDSVKYGHRVGTGNVWLLVAVLMQAEGRDSVAIKMIDRAQDEGLDPALADRMRMRLSQR